MKSWAYGDEYGDGDGEYCLKVSEGVTGIAWYPDIVSLPRFSEHGKVASRNPGVSKNYYILFPGGYQYRRLFCVGMSNRDCREPDCRPKTAVRLSQFPILSIPDIECT